MSREEIVLDISSLFFRKKSPDARFCALFNRILCLKRTGEKIYPVVDNEAFYVISQNARQRKRRFPRSISLGYASIRPVVRPFRDAAGAGRPKKR